MFDCGKSILIAANQMFLIIFFPFLCVLVNGWDIFSDSIKMRKKIKETDGNCSYFSVTWCCMKFRIILFVYVLGIIQNNIEKSCKWQNQEIIESERSRNPKLVKNISRKLFSVATFHFTGQKKNNVIDETK